MLKISLLNTGNNYIRHLQVANAPLIQADISERCICINYLLLSVNVVLADAFIEQTQTYLLAANMSFSRQSVDVTTHAFCKMQSISFI